MKIRKRIVSSHKDGPHNKSTLVRYTIIAENEREADLLTDMRLMIDEVTKLAAERGHRNPIITTSRTPLFVSTKRKGQNYLELLHRSRS